MDYTDFFLSQLFLPTLVIQNAPKQKSHRRVAFLFW